jgi:uncharacterized protein DUF6933
LLDPEDVQLAKTASRSVLGVMNDAAFLARYRIAAMGGIDRAELDIVNRFLRRTPHRRAGDYVRSIDLANAEASRPRRFEPET